MGFRADWAMAIMSCASSATKMMAIA